MTWPPASLPIDFENATPQENTHPDAHNTTNQTINADLVPEINRVGALADTIGLYLPLAGATLTGDLQVDGKIIVKAGGTLTGDLQVDGKIIVKAGGGATNAAIGFDGIDGMGIYSSVQNNYMRFAVSGAQRLAIKETEVVVNNDLQVDGQTKAQNGTKTAPAYSFKSDPDTGLYLENNVVSIVADGQNIANFGKDGVSFPDALPNTSSKPNVVVNEFGQLFRSTNVQTDSAELSRLETVIETLTARIEALEARLKPATTDV